MEITQYLSVDEHCIHNEEVAYLKALTDDLDQDEDLSAPQYLSPSKQQELDKLTAELETLIAEIFKDNPTSTSSVTWGDFQLDGDGSKSPLVNVVKVDTTTADVHALLDALQARVADNVKDAKLYSPINVESFASVQKVKAVIDWLDLRFTVDPTRCQFYKAPDARSCIKEFLTKRTGIRHYIAFDDSHITQDDASFTIRLHDVGNKKDLKVITDLLVKQYGAQREEMTIEAIELSLDFYGCNDGAAMVIKLHKAMRYPADARLLRIYKTKGTRQDIPTSPHALYELIEDGYNIGMGDHRSDAFCVRVYFKRTDKGGQALPKDQHRARIELTLRKSAFNKDEEISLQLDNLPKIIACGFKKMQFTHLSKRAMSIDKDQYFTQVKPFGKEQADSLSISRNKRNLPDAIASFAWLNEVKRNAVKDLAKKF
jgi:hypothetical protein